MDNGHLFVSRGTNSHTLLTPAIYGHWLSARCLFSLKQSRANCRYCILFKQLQISVGLTLVLYSHVIFFSATKVSLTGLSPQSLFLPFFLFVLVLISIQHVSWTFFSESTLITAIRMIRTPRHFP